VERDAAFAAVPRLRINSYFVDEHKIILPQKFTKSAKKNETARNLPKSNWSNIHNSCKNLYGRIF
jgi:hypothetical protein